MTDDEQLVIANERQLLDPAVRGDRARLEDLYHPDFVEFGSSGRVWTYDSSIAALLADPEPGIGAGFFAQNFSAHTIDANTIQVRFETGNPGRLVRRAGLWVRMPSGEWRIRFHQGTVVPLGFGE
jgi:ribonuclease HI